MNKSVFLPKTLASSMLGLGLIVQANYGVTAVLEEVVVTAQKRAQSVNDISVSANAFGGEQLKNLGIDNAVDVGAHTPGLVSVNATSGGTPIFAIRGIGLDDFSPNNTSGVGVYTDEVLASNPAFLSGQLFDIDRVEVLKGPQGTLYGKNTTGGAINFISRKPTEEFEAFVDVSYGSHKNKELVAAVSGALSDTVRGRLSAKTVKSDGWQKDINTGVELGSKDTFAVRGLLDFDIGDDGTVLTRVYHTKDKSIPVSPNVSGLGDALGDPSFSILDTVGNEDDVTIGSLPVGRDESGMGASINVNYSFENFDLISISSWDKYERVVVDNYDGSDAAILDFFQDDTMEQVSQEFRVVSNGDGALSWVAGVSWSNEEVDVYDVFDDSYLVTDSVVAGSYSAADVSLRGLDLLVGDYVQETDSLGVYFHTETELSDDWKLTVGLRYSSDDKSFIGVSTNTDSDNNFNDVLAELNESHDEESVTGKIGLDWNLNYDTLVYASVSTSYKGGAYYGAAVLDENSWGYVEPEDVTAYELGFKATLLEGAMQLNGAIFQLNYENRQSLITYVTDDFSDFLQIPVADTTLINIPKSEVSGFELDLNWALMDGLIITAGMAYLDSEVTQAPTAAGMRGISADPSVNQQAEADGFGFVEALSAPLGSGAILSQAPEWSYNASVVYEFPVSEDMNVRLQSNYSYVDSQVAQLSDSNAEYGPTEFIDVQVALADAADTWTVTLFANNIFASESDTYSYSSFAGRGYYRQQAETYGLSLRYNFD